jgi:hypothetical protein
MRRIEKVFEERKREELRFKVVTDEPQKIPVRSNPKRQV